MKIEERVEVGSAFVVGLSTGGGYSSYSVWLERGEAGDAGSTCSLVIGASSERR